MISINDITLRMIGAGYLQPYPNFMPYVKIQRQMIKLSAIIDMLINLDADECALAFKDVYGPDVGDILIKITGLK